MLSTSPSLSTVSYYTSPSTATHTEKTTAARCPLCGQTTCQCGAQTASKIQKPEGPKPGSKPGLSGSQELTKEEKQQVEKLKKTDRQVRAHEQAHMAAGGGVVRGGAKFQYKTGPDGNQYAVGGEVSIDTSSVPNDPQATIQKMLQVQRAALAPADPSSQDMRVAATAAGKAAKARGELAKKKQEEAKDAGQPVQGKEPFSVYTSKGTKSPITAAIEVSGVGAVVDMSI